VSDHFEAWAQFVGVRHLPCSPLDLARYILTNQDLSPELLFASVQSVDEKHEQLGYSPPGKSQIALEAFSKAHPIPMPRSWRAEEREMFALLPWSIKSIVARREAERDAALSKAQNDAAQWRKLKEKSNVDEKAKVA
jgi:hypothetical protein